MSKLKLAPIGMAAALLGLALTAGAAFAAGTTPDSKAPSHDPAMTQGSKMLAEAERCKLYEHRFDSQVAKHKDNAKIDEARVLRIEGGKLCAEGAQNRGISKLTEALKVLGIDTTY